MDIYETLSPIYVDEVKVGSLAVIYSLEGTNLLIRKVSLIALSVLLFLLITHGVMTLIIINKSNKIENLAYYDPLTKLPNASYFAEYLKEDMENFKGKRALIIINCSNLKLVRLIFGHQGSEDILAEIANKLKSLSFTNENLFRYSEDSFMIYIDKYKDKDHLVEYSNKIIDSFESSFKKVRSSKFTTVKIGVVEIDRKYENVDKIFKNAEITINNINDKENKSYSFFDESMSKEFIFKEIMERELKKAIYDENNQELYLEYQPQVDLKTNKIIGFEALARWNSKKLGFIPPMKFIDVAEKNQLIIPLGERILRTACEFIKDIEDKGYRDIKVAVNISLIQLLQDDFITTVMDIVDKTKIKPEDLELEVTETALMDNYEIINEKLSKLREEGINISLDDFGTGYSSLSRLRYLNINIIKIDKFFIDNLFGKNPDEVLTGTIIALAHRLGLKVVAEGVEMEEQKEYLIENHCDIMQGYLFSKPIKMENAIRLLEDNL